MDATVNSSTPVKEKSTLLDKKKQPRTVRDVVFDVSTGISNAILAVLGMGLLMASLGNLLHITPLVQAGLMGQKMLAPALGVGIAIMMRANILTTGAALIAATVGSNEIGRAHV